MAEGDGAQLVDGVNFLPVREESSEMTAVEGHSAMLFDVATHASDDHLVERYRDRLGPIFEDVLRSVRVQFLKGYKVRGHNSRIARSKNDRLSRFTYVDPMRPDPD